MSRLFPNPDLEETEPFASTFIPKIPPRAPAADAVNVEAELEEMELEEVPAPGAASFNPDPDLRQENGRLSPAPDTPDDENLLLLDNRMLKNNILKAMDVRQDTTEALFNRVANQMITNQDFTTNSIVGIETKITSLSTCTAKLSTDMKKHAKDQSAKTDCIDVELNNLKASLEKRITALETPPAPRCSPQRSALGLRTGGAEAAERHCWPLVRLQLQGAREAGYCDGGVSVLRRRTRQGLPAFMRHPEGLVPPQRKPLPLIARRHRAGRKSSQLHREGDLRLHRLR